jgi:hypothetical protein
MHGIGLFDVLAQAGAEKVLIMEPKAHEVRDRYMHELKGTDTRDLAIRSRMSIMNHMRGCT